MAATTILESMQRGDTHKFRVAVKNQRTGLAVGNLSGYLFFCTIKDEGLDPDEGVAQLILGDGIEVVDNLLSHIEVTIPPVVTSLQTGVVRQLGIDVQTVTPDGDVWTLGIGWLNVYQDVTEAVA